MIRRNVLFRSVIAVLGVAVLGLALLRSGTQREPESLRERHKKLEIPKPAVEPTRTANSPEVDRKGTAHKSLSQDGIPGRRNESTSSLPIVQYSSSLQELTQSPLTARISQRLQSEVLT